MKRSIGVFVTVISFLFLGSTSEVSSLVKNTRIANSNTSFTPNDSSVSICSFNIQFLGMSPERDNDALAFILKDFDIVVIQELVAPPFAGTFPDGTAFNPDAEAEEFFDDIINEGFSFRLSEEDTGTGPTNHINSSATEWWVVFFKSAKVDIASDLPTEFLATDRTDNTNYERVPYAFSFRTNNGNLDFVLISVHLKPDPGTANENRRKEELNSIASWVHNHDATEKDFIVLGDMNIQDSDELKDDTPSGFKSLNDECRITNTNVNGPKPYDHVMYRTHFTNEIDKDFDLRVYNLIEAMRPFWNSSDPYPGGAINPIGLPEYDHDSFRAHYSDHHPVVFKLNIPNADDD